MDITAKAKTLIIFLSCLTLSTYAQKRPNIVLILADDMGYSDLGCYGGEVQTPNLNKLASEGIRYRQFYNAARCCPTRASLMTGLYPHQAGMGWMAAADLGTPQYQGTLNNNCVTIAEVLKTAGYSTYMTGKWHLTNERKIDGMVTDSWPRQRGFDRYFGIVPGGANYFTPVIYSNNDRYPAPPDFYLTNAISDTTVKYIDQHFSGGSSDPMFMYVAYTSPHWPLHALQQEIDKYSERYLQGWDKVRQERYKRQRRLGVISKDTKLSPRDGEVQAWKSLPEEKQHEMAMRMAIYAAQIDIMDQGIGRIMQKLEEKGQLDNTLILFLSDNGACAEFISSGKSKEVTGKQNTFESYRLPWANVSSTPFRQYKHYTHEGGVATPLIAHWPAGIDKQLSNTFVADYGHITDIMATCVDVAQARYPDHYKGYDIVPLQGKSLVPHFKGKSNSRGVIYWEHEANIAVRDGKWKLVARTPEGGEFSKDSLELFDMEADPSEMRDLAARYPERVSAMYQAWLKWAKEIGAFPLDTRKYGVRMDAYKQSVNGTFDDNLGGWNVRHTKAVTGRIEIDTTGQLTGKNSVKVSMEKPGSGPEELAMLWNWKADKVAQYRIQLSAKTRQPTSFYLRVRTPGQEGTPLIDQQIAVAGGRINRTAESFTIPEKGTYQIGFYFGKLASGDEVWIDDVKLIPVAK